VSFGRLPPIHGPELHAGWHPRPIRTPVPV
jgi:hypothetical protein